MNSRVASQFNASASAHTAKLSGLRSVPDGMVRVQDLKMN